MLGRKGFTLTEMLFVVIIAAGVLALALPSYKKVKDRSQYQAATGMLMDLGNAVESITRDLSMQGVNVQGVWNSNVSYPPTGNSPINNENGTQSLKEFSGNNPNATTVAWMLQHFKYLDASFPNSLGGYNYYIGRTGSCADSGAAVVACMVKSGTLTDDDCFQGARYYQGGQLKAIRGSACRN